MDARLFRHLLEKNAAAYDRQWSMTPDKRLQVLQAMGAAPVHEVLQQEHTEQLSTNN